MADDGNKGAFDLLRGAEMGDVAHGDEDVAEGFICGEEGGVGHTDGKIGWVGAVEIAFDVEGSVGGEGPAFGFGFFEGCAVRIVCPADDVAVHLAGDLFARSSIELLEGTIDALNAMVCVEN